MAEPFLLTSAVPKTGNLNPIGADRGARTARSRESWAKAEKELTGPIPGVPCEAPHWGPQAQAKPLCLQSPNADVCQVLRALADVLELPNNKHTQAAKNYNLMQKYFAATGHSASDYYYLWAYFIAVL